MDWVKADWEGSSADHAWIALRERIKYDFEQFKELTAANGPDVRLTEEEGRISITCGHTPNTTLWMIAQKKGRHILWQSKAEGKGAPISALLFPTLNTAGEQRILYNDRELAMWEVSRMMLRPVLFGCGTFEM